MLTLATLASELKIENVALIAAGGKAKVKSVKAHSVSSASSASSVSMSSAAAIVINPSGPR